MKQTRRSHANAMAQAGNQMGPPKPKPTKWVEGVVNMGPEGLYWKLYEGVFTTNEIREVHGLKPFTTKADYYRPCWLRRALRWLFLFLTDGYPPC